MEQTECLCEIINANAERLETELGMDQRFIGGRGKGRIVMQTHHHGLLMQSCPWCSEDGLRYATEFFGQGLPIHAETFTFRGTIERKIDESFIGVHQMGLPPASEPAWITPTVVAEIEAHRTGWRGVLDALRAAITGDKRPSVPDSVTFSVTVKARPGDVAVGATQGHEPVDIRGMSAVAFSTEAGAHTAMRWMAGEDHPDSSIADLINPDGFDTVEGEPNEARG